MCTDNVLHAFSALYMCDVALIALIFNRMQVYSPAPSALGVSSAMCMHIDVHLVILVMYRLYCSQVVTCKL